MFKVKNNLAPEIRSNIFSFKTVPYNLRNSKTLECREALLTPEMRNNKCPEKLKKKI